MSDHNVHMSHCNTGEYLGTCKYNDDNCPSLTILDINPSQHPSPELLKFLQDGYAADQAKKYADEGYICISNKYRMIGRPDREDWHIALANQMRCAPADFIKRDGSGKLCDSWREHYVRCQSKDTLEVPDLVYTKLKKLRTW